MESPPGSHNLASQGHGEVLSTACCGIGSQPATQVWLREGTLDPRHSLLEDPPGSEPGRQLLLIPALEFRPIARLRSVSVLA